MTGDTLPALIFLIIVEVLLEFLRVPAGVPSGLLERLTLAILEFIVQWVKVNHNVPSFMVHPKRLRESIIVLFVAYTGRSVGGWYGACITGGDHCRLSHLHQNFTLELLYDIFAIISELDLTLRAKSVLLESDAR
jgi:hypothetical protein